jgi:hypothetical protein
MSDIVERLRLLQKHQQDNDAGEAADAIEALRAENVRLYALLVEAQDYIDDIYDELYIAIGKELEGHDLRAARKALGETDE